MGGVAGGQRGVTLRVVGHLAIALAVHAHSRDERVQASASTTPIEPGATIGRRAALRSDGAKLKTSAGSSIKVDVYGHGWKRVKLIDADRNDRDPRVNRFDINKGKQADRPRHRPGCCVRPPPLAHRNRPGRFDDDQGAARDGPRPATERHGRLSRKIGSSQPGLGVRQRRVVPPLHHAVQSERVVVFLSDLVRQGGQPFYTPGSHRVNESARAKQEDAPVSGMFVHLITPSRP